MSVELEGCWFMALSKAEKIAFLAAVGHALTISGRTSYSFQNEGLESPVRLRRINEIQHRVLACLGELLRDESSDSFQLSIASWVLDVTDPVDHQAISWAWYSVKESYHVGRTI
jgi:hypothetical protein